MSFQWLPEGEGDCWQEQINPCFSPGDVVMLSGCADAQTSSDGGRDRYGRPGGAMTTAFCEVMSCSSARRSGAPVLRGALSFCDLLVELRLLSADLEKKGGFY